MIRVTNRGARKWQIGGVTLRPGDVATVAADSWRLALDLNKALRFAVGSEVAVEEEARAAAPVVFEEPDYIEPAVEQPVEVYAEPSPPSGKRRKGRR